MFEAKYIGLLLASVVATQSQAQAEQLSDPTRRPNAVATGAASVGTGSAWQLQSTQISGQRRSAVINSKTVVEGDLINMARVLRIEHGRVVLNVAGQRTALSMFTTIGKSSAPAPVRPKLGSQE